jgi:hypothetical protein
VGKLVGIAAAEIEAVRVDVRNRPQSCRNSFTLWETKCSMELALKVLRVLVEYEAEPDTEIRTLEALEWWLDEAGHAGDETFFEGLAYASVQGWIVSKVAGTIEITAAGVVAAGRSVH